MRPNGAPAGWNLAVALPQAPPLPTRNWTLRLGVQEGKDGSVAAPAGVRRGVAYVSKFVVLTNGGLAVSFVCAQARPTPLSQSIRLPHHPCIPSQSDAIPGSFLGPGTPTPLAQREGQHTVPNSQHHALERTSQIRAAERLSRLRTGKSRDSAERCCCIDKSDTPILIPLIYVYARVHLRARKT